MDTAEPQDARAREETTVQALEMMLGPLDEFERITFLDLLREMPKWPPETEEDEKKLQQIGALALRKMGGIHQ